MAKLTDTVKRMLDALAFADAGEYLSARQKAQHMSPAAAPETTLPIFATAEAESVKSRQIALYMGSELPAEVMNYIMQTCARLKYGLTVLTFQPAITAHALLSPYTDALKSAGIAMQMVTLAGDPIPGLSRYLRRHPEVAFLACKETGYLGRGLLNGTTRQNALPVPVVLVESHAAGTQRSDITAPQQATADDRVA